MNLKLVKSDCLYPVRVLLIILVFTSHICCNKKLPGLIYILVWTNQNDWEYLTTEKGADVFIKNNCFYQNCFVTDNRSYFSSVLDFDVLLFNVKFINSETNLPLIRSQSQLYILVSFEPAFYNPIPEKFNGIFNMSLGYKLTSSVIYPYVVIRNKHGKVIGPRKHMHWKHDIKDMAPTTRDVMNKLQYKNIAAAVIISDCYASNNRSEFIKSLKEELLRYGQKLDIYGDCSFANLKCPRVQGERSGVISTCSSEIESNYYFYLAFENSHSEDYVSEKLLHALTHFAVPVVYGGANYTRFMPDGIYLNARTLGVKKLAQEMSNIIYNPQTYIDFFKWRGYYTFYDTHKLDSNDTYFICNVCSKLNKRIQGKQISVYTSITHWWNVKEGLNQIYEPNTMNTDTITTINQSGTTGVIDKVLSVLNYIMFKT